MLAGGGITERREDERTILLSPDTGKLRNLGGCRPLPSIEGQSEV
jgi:hypothetical protein